MAKKSAIIWTDIITTSSHISQIGYNVGRKTLHIIFYNGHWYRYSGVPAEVVIGLLQAASHGTYFWSHIRGYYQYVKIRS